MHDSGPAGRWRVSESAVFWALVVAHLAPVWAFRYLPTQDGPAHVANAVILKDWNSTAGYAEFFELRLEALPNLTSHVMLAALLYMFPALIAEKILVSLYIAGSAAALRYFLGAFGPRCLPLSWAALLLIYNRCFWLGFYNHCLGLILVFAIFGYCLRRRGTIEPSQPFVLALLFTAAFFTHLAAYLLALAGAMAAALLARSAAAGPSETEPSPLRTRALALILVLLAALPAACLAMEYFERTGFFRSPHAMRVIHRPLATLRGEQMEKPWEQELAALDDELFAHHARTPFPFGLIALTGFALLVGLRLADYAGGCDNDDEDGDGPGVLFPAAFGFILLAGYVLAPNHLDFEHGGFLKARLAPLPPLVWLACLREPARRAWTLGLRVLTVLLLAVNLFLVTRTAWLGNEELAEYTVGVNALGGGHRLFVAQPDPSPTPLVNPLLHASDYYAHGRGNINLDNYEASMPHFPVKFRKGVARGRGNWSIYAHRDAVDVVIWWQTSPDVAPPSPPGWDEVVAQGRLRIYLRP